MISPPLAPRVEEADEGATLNVDRTDIASLPRVASETGICKIIEIRSPAMFAANDVVDLMRRIRIFFMQEAVLASIGRAFGDESPQRLADVTSQADVAVPAPSP